MLPLVVQSAAAAWRGASYERIAAAFAPIHDRVIEARAGVEVVGVDISAGQLAKARAAAEAEGFAVQFDDGDAELLPYPEGAFDVAASVFGAAHALWELLSTSVPPLRAWLAEQNDHDRTLAERVDLDFLGPGELRRDSVLVLGRRR
jgi:hypothetical protein